MFTAKTWSQKICILVSRSLEVNCLTKTKQNNNNKKTKFKPSLQFAQLKKILQKAGLGDRARSRVHTCSEKKLMYVHKYKISKGLCTNTLLYGKTMHISFRFKRHWKWNSHLQFHKSQQDWNVFVHSCVRWGGNSKHCDLLTYRGVTYYIYPYGFCKSRSMQRRWWSVYLFDCLAHVESLF
jgi:hypothetical protein